jgi:hypothetical protein
MIKDNNNKNKNTKKKRKIISSLKVLDSSADTFDRHFLSTSVPS